MGTDDRRYLEETSDSFLDELSLTAAAASELTSPLVLMRQLSMAIASEDVSDAERRQLAEKLTLTSERTLRQTANLRLSSANQSAFALEPINPVSICQDVIHELTPLFLAQDKAITLQPRIRVPLLVANRHLLQRILLGFGDNALPYGSKEQPIRMTISGRGNTVRIGVRDFGPAVPADIWHKLETRIARRAQSPLASRPQTSGVGLVTARRLAELMHSTVGTVRHRDGTTFYIDMHVSNQMSLL